MAVIPGRAIDRGDGALDPPDAANAGNATVFGASVRAPGGGLAPAATIGASATVRVAIPGDIPFATKPGKLMVGARIVLEPPAAVNPFSAIVGDGSVGGDG